MFFFRELPLSLEPLEAAVPILGRSEASGLRFEAVCSGPLRQKAMGVGLTTYLEQSYDGISIYVLQAQGTSALPTQREETKMQQVLAMLSTHRGDVEIYRSPCLSPQLFRVTSSLSSGNPQC